MTEDVKVRRKAKRMRHGVRYTLVGPSGGAMHATLFGTIQNGKARYLVLRQDQRGGGRR